MTGHAFGWSAAVYNFNRRARLKQEILRKLFFLPCWAYYDDLYGLETDETVDNAVVVARKVHELLGILYGEHKVKQGPDVDLLGVAFRLPKLKVGITAKRRKQLCSELKDIWVSNRLSPGKAGKLKGKLNFVGNQLWGKTGKAVMPALSNRQYLNKVKLTQGTSTKFKKNSISLDPNRKSRAAQRNAKDDSNALDDAL